MDNYKKQILQRVIDFYIEKAEVDKKTIKTVACLMNDLEAINYTRCSTQLKDKKTITFDEFAKENNYKQNFLYFYRDGKTFKPSEIMKRYKTYLLNL
jgi:hypothetical protein